MKIKISDLVIKVINREEMPKEILFNGNIYKWCQGIGDYRKDGWGSCLMIKDVFYNFDKYGSFYNMLFEDVEINEKPKKIEKLEPVRGSDLTDLTNKDIVLKNNALINLCKTLNNINNKVNELIDEINNLKEK